MIRFFLACCLRLIHFIAPRFYEREKKLYLQNYRARCAAAHAAQIEKRLRLPDGKCHLNPSQNSDLLGAPKAQDSQPANKKAENTMADIQTKDHKFYKGDNVLAQILIDNKLATRIEKPASVVPVEWSIGKGAVSQKWFIKRKQGSSTIFYDSAPENASRALPDAPESLLDKYGALCCEKVPDPQLARDQAELQREKAQTAMFEQDNVSRKLY